MKLVTTIMLVILANSAFAASAFEKKNKEEMVQRTDTIIEKFESARQFLKNEETAAACDELRELLRIYPEHLKSIGMHMNNYKTKVAIARDEVLQQLIFVHRQSVVCGQGSNAEYVDPKDLDKKLKKILKSVKKQRKLISKEDTGRANEFHYRYDF